jgi:putative pyruvate formate lyase activating enzyme
LGICRSSGTAEVASYNAHYGEESPLVGRHGSGTIFFAHCNLRCVFCQNYDISHGGHGFSVDARSLADMMLDLQRQGCHNINFVTPSHVVAQILEALEIAIAGGLRIPLVYNTNAYDRVETLQLLDGLIDIYMPDFKFWRPETAHRFCNARDYPAYARTAILEMHRQVGDLVIDPDGIAVSGLLIRHLVLPAGLADTKEIMRFIARDISSNSYVNIMHQYRPCGEASRFPPLDMTPKEVDYKSAVDAARAEGVTRLDRPLRRFVIW